MSVLQFLSYDTVTGSLCLSLLLYHRVIVFLSPYHCYFSLQSCYCGVWTVAAKSQKNKAKGTRKRVDGKKQMKKCGRSRKHETRE